MVRGLNLVRRDLSVFYVLVTKISPQSPDKQERGLVSDPKNYRPRYCRVTWKTSRVI